MQGYDKPIPSIAAGMLADVIEVKTDLGVFRLREPNVAEVISAGAIVSGDAGNLGEAIAKYMSTAMTDPEGNKWDLEVLLNIKPTTEFAKVIKAASICLGFGGANPEATGDDDSAGGGVDEKKPS